MQSFIIGLREGLESLILLFILNNLISIEKIKKSKNPIIIGGILGIILSLVIAFVISYAQKTTGISHDKFEFILEVIVVMSIIYLVATMPKLTKSIINDTEDFASKSFIPLLLIALTISSREAIEVILFNFALDKNSWMFSIFGILLATIIAFLINVKNKKVNLKKLFFWTTIYVILLSGYLFGHLINLSIELGYLNLTDAKLYNLSNTMWDTHTSIFGYIVKIITSWPYKVGIVQFISQYIFTTIGGVYYLYTRNTQNKK